jgi:hypothetical protein
MFVPFSYITLSEPPPVDEVGASTYESTPAPFVDKSCPELPVLAGNCATFVPLATIPICPELTLKNPVSVSDENVILGTETVPSGKVPPAFK